MRPEARPQGVSDHGEDSVTAGKRGVPGDSERAGPLLPVWVVGVERGRFAMLQARQGWFGPGCRRADGRPGSGCIWEQVPSARGS